MIQLKAFFTELGVTISLAERNAFLINGKAPYEAIATRARLAIGTLAPRPSPLNPRVASPRVSSPRVRPNLPAISVKQPPSTLTQSNIRALTPRRTLAPSRRPSTPPSGPSPSALIKACAVYRIRPKLVIACHDLSGGNFRINELKFNENCQITYCCE